MSFLLFCAQRRSRRKDGTKLEKFSELSNALDGGVGGLARMGLLLSGVIAKETRHYLENLDEKDTTEIPVVRR